MMKVKVLLYIIFLSFIITSENEKIIELVDGDKIIGEIINESESFVIVKTGYGELNIPNELTETIREKAEDLNLEFVMDRKLH